MISTLNQGPIPTVDSTFNLAQYGDLGIWVFDGISYATATKNDPHFIFENMKLFDKRVANLTINCFQSNNNHELIVNYNFNLKSSFNFMLVNVLLHKITMIMTIE